VLALIDETDEAVYQKRSNSEDLWMCENSD